MSQNINDSYISAITASTENQNQDQSFRSKNLENTNDILLLHLNELSLNKKIKKEKNNKSIKKLSNKTFFLSKPCFYKEDYYNLDKWNTNIIKLDKYKNSNNILYKLFKEEKYKKHSYSLMALKEKGKYIIRNNFGIIAKITWNIFSNHFKVYNENNNLIEEIIYEFNFKGWYGPTKLKVILPKLNKNKNSTNLTNTMNNSIYKLKNKEPIFNDFFNVYTLDFKDRKVIPNEKNIQIIFQDFIEDNNNILLQFAQSDKGFILDYKHPFNNITAFALAISVMSSRTFCK